MSVVVLTNRFATSVSFFVYMCVRTSLRLSPATDQEKKIKVQRETSESLSRTDTRTTDDYHLTKLPVSSNIYCTMRSCPNN